MMRPLIVCALPVATLLVLGGCASSGRPMETYAAATDRLAEECRARGGILQPTSQSTGRPETDNVCKITGGAYEAYAK